MADVACLAVSLVTGLMIRKTVEIARGPPNVCIRTRRVVIPGGWHSSLLPGQTLACEDVDILVKGKVNTGYSISCRVSKREEDCRGLPVLVTSRTANCDSMFRARKSHSSICRRKRIIFM